MSGSTSNPREMTVGDSSADDVCWLGASELARRIARGELTAVDAVEAHIRRIEKVNVDLNAVVEPRFDAARREAHEADARAARGEPRGPLGGVPITVKECFFLPGTRATIGVGHLNEMITGESVLVARLRAAGAIVLGKTNVPQLMAMHETDNPVYGRTNNPWNIERGPGGSSGGEAAIVAAGGSPLGLGNDLGGSIRQPAHSCGICGLKPTNWRFPEVGVRTNWHGLETVISQAGPLARHVDDLTLAMRVLAAPGLEQFEPRIPPVPWREPAEVSLATLGIGYWEDDGYFPASPAVRRATHEAAEALAARGLRVIRFAPPDVPRAIRDYFGLISADGGGDARRIMARSPRDPRIAKLLLLVGLGRTARAAAAGTLRVLGQKWLAELVRSTGGISADAYWQLTHARAQYAARFQQLLQAQQIDVLLCPPHALPALPHGASEHLAPAASYAMLFNYLGWPAGVVSLTRVRPEEQQARSASSDPTVRAAVTTDAGSAGLPVGVQVAATPWREDRVLAVMRALEEAFIARDGFPRQPR